MVPLFVALQGYGEFQPYHAKHVVHSLEDQLQEIYVVLQARVVF